MTTKIKWLIGMGINEDGTVTRYKNVNGTLRPIPSATRIHDIERHIAERTKDMGTAIVIPPKPND